MGELITHELYKPLPKWLEHTEEQNGLTLGGVRGHTHL